MGLNSNICIAAEITADKIDHTAADFSKTLQRAALGLTTTVVSLLGLPSHQIPNIPNISGQPNRLVFDKNEHRMPNFDSE